MQQITINVNPSIYEHIMFFLQNLPKNLVDIESKKTPASTLNDNKIKFGLAKNGVVFVDDIMAENKEINNMFYRS